MNLATFNISLSESRTLIKDLKLLKLFGIKSINKNGTTKEFKDAAQKGDYINAYKLGILNFDYDFLLFDNSFFQFSISFRHDKLYGLNYSFYQNPFYYRTYEDYLEILRLELNLDNDFINEIGDLYIEEYEQFLNEQTISSGCTIIRYDYDVPNYKPLIHPSSHIHIGNNTSVRIPYSKLLSPYRFTLFIIRHIYYDFWIKTINNPESRERIYHNKYTCQDLEQYWDELEKIDLYLT